MAEETKQLIAFFHFLEGLKKLERYRDNIFWRDYHWIERWESVADHTWRMAMMLVVLEKRLQRSIDLARALKITLVHDLPEIIAGDESALGSDESGVDSHHTNPERKQEKFMREEAAAREIFGMLPEEEREEYYALWREYEDLSSYEAQVVKAIDKLEARFQIIEYTDCRVYEKHLQPIKEIGLQDMEKEPVVKELYDALMQHFDAHYTEFTKPERAAPSVLQ